MGMIMRNSSIVTTRESNIYKVPAVIVIPEEQDIVILIGPSLICWLWPRARPPVPDSSHVNIR